MRSRPSTSPATLYAPGRSSPEISYRCPSRNDPLPAVDEHMIPSESRYEIVRGERVYAAPAREGHGRVHADLATLLTTHATADYLTAVDLLTRVSTDSEVAPDASVYPKARDAHGHRQVERLAFEIADATRPNQLTDKAHLLVRRGVARIFCIDIQKHVVLEWNASSNRWDAMAAHAVIEDESLEQSLPVSTLLDWAKRDDAVARVLVARHNHVIEEEKRKSEQKGKIEGLREGEVKGHLEGERTVLLKLMRAKFGVVSDSVRTRIENAMADELERWAERVLTASSVEEVLAP